MIIIRYWKLNFIHKLNVIVPFNGITLQAFKTDYLNISIIVIK